MKEEEMTMKKRALIIVSAAIITVASIGGYAFAQGSNKDGLNYQPKAVAEETETRRNYYNHCRNNEEMIQIMKNNGFEDMAKWMEEGNFEAMDEFMNNMTDEDYEKMIDLMSENGYGHISRMMGSRGREDMINMHNSMMGRNGSRFNKMGRMMRSIMGRF